MYDTKFMLDITINGQLLLCMLAERISDAESRIKKAQEEIDEIKNREIKKAERKLKTLKGEEPFNPEKKDDNSVF